MPPQSHRERNIKYIHLLSSFPKNLLWKWNSNALQQILFKELEKFNILGVSVEQQTMDKYLTKENEKKEQKSTTN